MSLAALAAAEQVRPPTMSRIVDALVARRPGDARAGAGRPPLRRASPRPTAGVALLEEGRARRVGALVARLGTLTDYERRALARGVEILERVTR